MEFFEPVGNTISNLSKFINLRMHLHQVAFGVHIVHTPSSLPERPSRSSPAVAHADLHDLVGNGLA